MTSRILEPEFLGELHRLLWIPPKVNRGILDFGWNCRDHAVVLGAVFSELGLTPAIVHGRATFVSGPIEGKRPVGIEQHVHSWVHVPVKGVFDLSPKLSEASPPEWRPQPFIGIAEDTFLPTSEGSFHLAPTAREFENAVNRATNLPGTRAIYLELRKEVFSPTMVDNAFEYVNSPLTDILKRSFDRTICRKMVAHLVGVISGGHRRIAGLSSQGKAWREVARDS